MRQFGWTLDPSVCHGEGLCGFSTGSCLERCLCTANKVLDSKALYAYPGGFRWSEHMTPPLELYKNETPPRRTWAQIRTSVLPSLRFTGQLSSNLNSESSGMAAMVHILGRLESLLWQTRSLNVALPVQGFCFNCSQCHASRNDYHTPRSHGRSTISTEAVYLE